MKSESIIADSLAVLSRFRQIVRESEGRDQALERLTQFCLDVLNSEACALSIFDSSNSYLRFEILVAPDLNLKRYLARQQIRLPSSNGSAERTQDAATILTLPHGVSLSPSAHFEKIGNPFGLKVSTCVIKPREQVLGFLHSFSEHSHLHEEVEAQWLAVFAQKAEDIFEQYSLHPPSDESFRILNSVVQEALLDSPTEFLRRISDAACQLLSTPICIVWQRDQNSEKLKIAATTGDVDEEFQRLELDYDLPGIKHFRADRKVAYALDLTRPQTNYIHMEQARERGWCSIMTAPMWIDEKLVGLLDVYTPHPHRFESRERELFVGFANHAALAIQRAELLRETIELRERGKQSVHDQLISEIQKAINRVSSVSYTGPDGDLTATLNEVAEKCASATHAHACFIRLWDMKVPSLKLEAFHVEEHLKPEVLLGHRLIPGVGISGYVAQTGKSFTCDDITEYPEHSDLYSRLDIYSVICVPIKSGDALLGTISVGHHEKKAFHPEQQQLLENLVDSLAVSIERAHLMDCLLNLQEANMQSESLDKLLEKLANFTRDLMMEPICLVSLCASDQSAFTIRAHAENENEPVPLETNEPIPENEGDSGNQKIQVDFKKLFHERDSSLVAELLNAVEPIYVADASWIEPDSRGKKIKELGWKSLLAMPLRSRRRVHGTLEVYSKEQRQFTDVQKRQFKILANQASIAIESRHRLERLTQLMQAVAECSDRDKLIEIIFKGALEIAETERGWISILNPKTKKLEVMRHYGAPENIQPLYLGEGISGRALKNGKPIRLNDVSGNEYQHLQHLHTSCWDDTRAILAVPIITNQTQTRVGNDVLVGEKKIGVINLESADTDAFSQADENAVLSLARNAAVNLEKLEFDRRLRNSRVAVKEIVSERDWDKTIQLAMRKIKETLDFEYVAISMISPEDTINMEYVIGIPEVQIEEFKKRNRKPLSDNNDIRADILRKSGIEVPALDDARLDLPSFRVFKLEQFIRVFVPMIVSPGGRAIGIVEAGYAHNYQPNIYERDVQILKGYVDNLALSLDQKKRGMLPKIIHEFNAPVVAIRNNTSFLIDHLADLPHQGIQQKLTDMLTETQHLFLRVEELEHILGGKPPAQSSSPTLVYGDIVIKTVEQIIPLVEERHFDPLKIDFHPEYRDRIKLSVNGDKLRSAVHNLLMNSIKYAEDDPADFKISIDLEETILNYIIKIKDWGIGIKAKYSQKIFEDGFRTPEASSKNVTGSGLGLTIALKNMQDAGGDLRLVNNRKPTEFHLILPRTVQEATK